MGITNIQNVYWDDGCIMFNVPGDIELIGLEHLLFGESPLYIKGDYKLIGIDSISKRKLREYMKNVEKIEWEEIINRN